MPPPRPTCAGALVAPLIRELEQSVLSPAVIDSQWS
jgi:hypothetical protein